MTDTLNTQQVSYQDAYEYVNRYIHSERAASIAMDKALRDGNVNMATAITKFSAASGWNTTTALSDITTETNESFTALVDEFNTATASIRANAVAGKITADYARESIATLNKSKNWVGKLDAIITHAETAIQLVQTRYDIALKRLTTPKGSGSNDVVTEMRVGRAWDRIIKELDAQVNKGTLAAVAVRNRLSNTTDPYELAAIVREGVSYLTAHGASEPAEGINRALGEIDPEVANAAAAVQAHEKFKVVLRHDEQIIRRILTSNALTTATLAKSGYTNPANVQY